MAAYQITLLDPAARELAGLDKPMGRRVVARLRWLAAHFDEIKPEGLTGDLAGLYKLRIGDYRVIYEILSAERTIVIHAIGHRRQIYHRR
jgi:mRNA interferase RelE/StbE